MLGKTKVGWRPRKTTLAFPLMRMQPDAEIYTKALELMRVAPSEAIMVAAHAYDLRAAKTV